MASTPSIPPRKTWPGWVRKTHLFCAILYALKAILLPRQARDKHRGTRKEMRVSQAHGSHRAGSDGTRCAYHYCNAFVASVVCLHSLGHCVRCPDRLGRAAVSNRHFAVEFSIAAVFWICLHVFTSAGGWCGGCVPRKPCCVPHHRGRNSCQRRHALWQLNGTRATMIFN